MEDSLFEVEGERFDVAVVGVEVSESVESRGFIMGAACADGRPSGPSVWAEVGADDWVVSGADVLSVLAEGVLIGPDGLRGGIEGAGKRSSVYISSRIFDSPTMAAGWSAKLFSANSNCASAVYGADSTIARAPRLNVLVMLQCADEGNHTSKKISAHSSAILLPPPHPGLDMETSPVVSFDTSASIFSTSL